MFAAIANGGDQITPQLQKGSDVLTRRQPINLSPTTLEELQQGLRAVVTHGTGKAIKHFFTSTCGGQKRHCRRPTAPVSRIVWCLRPGRQT